MGRADLPNNPCDATVLSPVSIHNAEGLGLFFPICAKKSVHSSLTWAFISDLLSRWKHPSLLSPQMIDLRGKKKKNSQNFPREFLSGFKRLLHTCAWNHPGWEGYTSQDHPVVGQIIHGKEVLTRGASGAKISPSTLQALCSGGRRHPSWGQVLLLLS